MISTVRRMLVRVAALILLVTVVAGLPTALVIVVGWPLPTAIPTVDGLSGWLTSPISDTVIINALAVAAWLLWAAFIPCIAAEARAAWHGTPTPAIARGTANPFRGAAAALITAIALGTLPALTSAASLPASALGAHGQLLPARASSVSAVLAADRGPATFHIGRLLAENG